MNKITDYKTSKNYKKKWKKEYIKNIKKDNEEFMKDLEGNVRKTIEGMGL